MLTVGTTPLLRAAKACDVPATQLLLKRGAMADLQNSLGATPLMAAAGVGWATVDIRGRFRNEPPCIETAGLLLDAGADINAANNNGQTALHGAAQLGWTQVVRYLGGRGAKLDLKDGRGTTPLDIAMGRSGSTGRAGVAGAETHPETATALRELLAASSKP
jgi:ankyrin repeat protein